MSEKKAKFLPFHAINEFMRNDYRLSVIRSVLLELPSLSEERRAPIDRLTKKYVRVPGFRNGAKAPASIRVKPTVEAFEKSPQLVAAILAAWAETQPELRQNVYDLLVLRGWEILPVEADRAQLPGFIAAWPKGENFEIINSAFTESYPEAQATSDDISLMVVWLSVRLPFAEESSEEQETAALNDDSREI
jgi:hypothetical protein